MAPEFLSEIGVWTELWESEWREGNEQGRGQVSLRNGDALAEATSPYSRAYSRGSLRICRVKCTLEAV